LAIGIISVLPAAGCSLALLWCTFTAYTLPSRLARSGPGKRTRLHMRRGNRRETRPRLPPRWMRAATARRRRGSMRGVASQVANSHPGAWRC
jgi:hypothetical protein